MISASILQGAAEQAAHSDRSAVDLLLQASGVVAAVTLINGLLVSRAARKTRREGTTQARLGRDQVSAHRDLDLVRTQLNELYGPLFMHRRASERLRALLPNEAGWRLVDHIAEVRNGSHPEWEVVVDEILSIDEQISHLLIGKAGLFAAFPPPPSFQEFVAHARLLRIYWDLRQDQPAAVRVPFPSNLDADIRHAIDLLEEKARALTTRAG